ncbi:nwd2 [Moniliophthora roreri MCA 2997]|uniref:Nwd2 n=1 Tax=Moniliophthora roreri (strain MCA 2997) TaxID=1381753 RepID=V2YJ78_MONRO|nr:nwd2 [Moniliophthora roreri MCA 2997]
MAVNGASSVSIHGGAYNLVHGEQMNTNTTNYFGSPDVTLEKLAAHAAMNATCNSGKRFPPPNCYPGTRTNTLDTLSRWIEDDTRTTKVYWVYGSAGVGKTAIAQKLSEDYASSRLAAAFFFSRNDSTCDKLDPFVATVAYQLCTSDTLRNVIGPLVIEAIRLNPNIFLTSSENQFRKLLLEPYSKLELDQQRQLPNLIVVDGLDECIDPSSQQGLLDIIGHAILFSVPMSFIFLILSRPEPQIRHGFDSTNFVSILECLPISDETIRFLGHLSESDCDIERYLSGQFSLLRKKHRAALRDEGPSWPSRDAIRDLVRRASGQFLFAVTVIKYIDTRDHLPQDRLKTILMAQASDNPDSPYPDLDLLYRQILSVCRNWGRVRPILRLLVTPHPEDTEDVSTIRWRSTPIIASLLKLRTGEVETLLSRLHSVIYVPEDEGSDMYILHVSFTEFLLDSTRSREHHTPEMPQAEYKDLLAVLLLRKLAAFTTFYPPYQPSAYSFDAALVIWQQKLGSVDDLTHFACGHWIDYCVEVESPSADLIAELNRFDPYPVAAILLSNLILELPWLCLWKDGISWSKSLRIEATQTFTTKLESFFFGFDIAFGPMTTRRIAIQMTSQLEKSLVYLGDIAEFRLLISFYHFHHRTVFPLLLPSSSDTAATLPSTWVTAHVTTANGEVLYRVSDAFSSHPNHQEYLANLKDGLSEMARQDLVKGEDVACLKALLDKRQEQFAVLADITVCSAESCEFCNGKDLFFDS